MFVHTLRMKDELIKEFGVSAQRVSTIPFGINDTVPTTKLSSVEAKRMLGLKENDQTLLFFGQIAPYKGLEYLIDALALRARAGDSLRLIIAGKVKRGSAEYWAQVERLILDRGVDHLVVRRIGFVPDQEVEWYFKAADVAVIPYVSIFQSGIPFLAFSFGVPVIATDVGSLREDVVAETGLICRAKDPLDLANAINDFFCGNLYREREIRREGIRLFALRHHSWSTVGAVSKSVYLAMLGSGRKNAVDPIP